MCNKIPFNKPSLSIDEQITLLKSRRLLIVNEEFVKNRLSTISYYRLSAYFRPFYIRDKELFKENTTFEDILQVYYFDKELRRIVFNELESIEVFFRTQLIEVVSKDNAFEYLNLINENKKEEIIAKIEKEIRRSKEVFVKHFKNRYSNTHFPIWMIVETISFSLLSMFFKHLKEDVKKEIANRVYLPIDVLESWIHNLVYVRNICAHHSRLWNRMLAIKAKVPRKKVEFKGLENKKIFFTLSIIQYLLNYIDQEENSLKNELKTLFAKYPNISKRNKGFPNNWEEIEIWKY